MPIYSFVLFLVILRPYGKSCELKDVDEVFYRGRRLAINFLLIKS